MHCTWHVLLVIVFSFLSFATSYLTMSSSSSSSIDERVNPRWHACWERGVPIGSSFDTGGIVSPALQQLIDNKVIPTGRALVPGCGRGYDIVALASEERYALGIDMSGVAVKEALAAIDKLPTEKRPSPETFDIKEGSFFDLSEEEDQKFDFIYDYTFLCALDPSIRTAWARKMAALVKPGGELLTLIFPIRDNSTEGPPFQVSLELFTDLLTPIGFECMRLELLPSELCHRDRDGSALLADPNSRMGKSGIGRWRRK